MGCAQGMWLRGRSRSLEADGSPISLREIYPRLPVREDVPRERRAPLERGYGSIARFKQMKLTRGCLFERRGRLRWSVVAGRSPDSNKISRWRNYAGHLRGGGVPRQGLGS